MLELRYPVEPDKHGVIDGVQLATHLIRNAVNLLIPYVANCRACLDAIFSQIANSALETVHQELSSGQKSGAFLFTVGIEDAQRQDAITAHLADNKEAIAAFLESAMDEHAHHH
jgi:hypothetical protein